jgi:hypothetical protein
MEEQVEGGEMQLIEKPRTEETRRYEMLVGGEWVEAVGEYTQTKTVWVELSGKTRDPFTLG